MMKIVVLNLLPLAVILVSLFAGKIRSWLERQARDAVSQGKLVEVFQENVSAFLRASDSEKHAELREILCWSGRIMMKDSVLIQAFITHNHQLTSGENHQLMEGQPNSAKKGEARAAFEGLSEGAKHNFARAVGTALIVSSYQSIWFGHLYRSMLMWVVNNKNEEVKEPEQIVYRYRRVRSEPAKRYRLATA